MNVHQQIATEAQRHMFANGHSPVSLASLSGLPVSRVRALICGEETATLRDAVRVLDAMGQRVEIGFYKPTMLDGLRMCAVGAVEALTGVSL